MRVAFITVGNPRRLTGGYLYHAQVIAGLRALGMHIDEIVASGAALVEQRAAAAQFGTTFAGQHYDVVLIDALARGVCTPWVSRWQELCPVVVLVHQLPSIAEAEPAQIALEQRLEAPLLSADYLVAVSQHGRALLAERGVPPERVVIISPGFDRLPVHETQRGQVTNDHDSIHALCVAQWVPRKGITTLIAAWAERAWPHATLELIGETNADSTYTMEVRAALAATHDGSILVHGVVSDDALQQAYHAADIFVLPSRFEGYGMVYAEALAHGLPIIACNVGPVPELVTAAAGLFVPPDNPSALAATLARIFRDRELRQQLAAGAAQRAATLPRWDGAVRGFQQVLMLATQRKSG